jgi:hypothetical protein
MRRGVSMANAKHSSRERSWENQSTLARLSGVMENCVIVAKAMIDIGGIVAVEWPGKCKYWREPDVEDFLKEFRFDLSVFHGCACELVTRHSPRPNKPMKKLWRCSSNNPKMLTYLDKKCAGDHKHGECQGGDCKASEDYTPGIIDAIHMGFKLGCGPSYKNAIASRDGRVYLYPRNTLHRITLCPAWIPMGILLSLQIYRHIVRVMR